MDAKATICSIITLWVKDLLAKRHYLDICGHRPHPRVPSVLYPEKNAIPHDACPRQMSRLAGAIPIKKVAMMDQFKNHTQGLESPASRLFEIVPSDATPLALATRAIAVDSAGHVQVVTINGDTGRVFIAAGVPFPLRVTQIMATGTTATGIVGLA